MPTALEDFIGAQVEQGAYSSRRAAIVACVANEKRRVDRRASLALELQEGLNSGSAGPLNMKDVIRRGRGRLVWRQR